MFSGDGVVKQPANCNAPAFFRGVSQEELCTKKLAS